MNDERYGVFTTSLKFKPLDEPLIECEVRCVCHIDDIRDRISDELFHKNAHYDDDPHVFYKANETTFCSKCLSEEFDVPEETLLFEQMRRDPEIPPYKIVEGKPHFTTAKRIKVYFVIKDDE